MALNVTYKNDAFPDGHVFGVVGLGDFENGKGREVTDEQEVAFLSTYGQTVRERLAGDKNFNVSGTAELSKKEVEAARPSEAAVLVHLPEQEGGSE